MNLVKEIIAVDRQAKEIGPIRGNVPWVVLNCHDGKPYGVAIRFYPEGVTPSVETYDAAYTAVPLHTPFR